MPTIFTPMDLLEHVGIAIALQDKQGRYLCFYHRKFQFWTIPLGKANPGQTAEEALIMEAREELGIELTKFEKLRQSDFIYKRAGKDITAHITLFRVIEFYGEISNREPQKHDEMGFFPIKIIEQWENTSDGTSMLLEFLTLRANGGLAPLS